ELAEPEVPADSDVLVPLAAPSPTDVSVRPQQLVELVVVGHHDPALAGGDRLRRLEAEDTDIADGSDGSAAPRGPMRLGSVLDDSESVPLSGRHHPVHVRRRPAV